MLLDTCTVLWLAADKSKLSEEARRALREARGPLFVSAISAFEIAARYRMRALQLPMPPDDWYREALEFFALQEIPISGSIAARAALLPPHHDDLCDRTIVATALERGLPIVTPDASIGAYEGVSIIW